MGDARGIGHVAARLLDAHHVGMGGEALDIAHGDGATRATRDVIEDARDAHRIGGLLEVLVDALFVRLVVVGRDDEQGVGAKFLVLEALGRLSGGAVGTRACDDGDAARDVVHDELDDGVILLVRHRGALARGAEREDCVRAILDVELEQTLELVEVDRAILVERRDEGYNRAFELAYVHGFLLM